MQLKQINIAFLPWGHTCWMDLYLPDDYDATKKYPLLVALHGIGELGNTEADLVKLVEAVGSIPQRISVTGKLLNPKTGLEYQMIIAAPQTPTIQGSTFGEEQLTYLLQQLEGEYPAIDLNRIGVTGYSAGGQGALTCITDSTTFPKTICFLHLVSAEPITGTQETALLTNDAIDHLPMWFVCGTGDAFYSPNLSYVQALEKAGVTPAPIASWIPNGGHWSTQAYDPTWYGEGSESGGLNVYDKFLTCSLTAVTTAPPPPPPPPPPVVVPPTVTVTITGEAAPVSGTVVTVVFKDAAGDTLSTISATIA